MRIIETIETTSETKSQNLNTSRNTTMKTVIPVFYSSNFKNFNMSKSNMY